MIALIAGTIAALGGMFLSGYCVGVYFERGRRR
jgi:hypothetical protein